LNQKRYKLNQGSKNKYSGLESKNTTGQNNSTWERMITSSN